MPDQLAVLEHLADTVERHMVCFPVLVQHVEGKVIGGVDGEIGERHQDDASPHPVVIANHELAATELPVPADAIQQRLDRNHCALD